MSAQIRCPYCNYARPAGSEDAPAFHKPGCKARRALQAAKRTEVRDQAGRTILTTAILAGDTTCKLDQSGLVVAAVSFDGLRWRAQP